jgi:hypothetical protein
MATSELVVGTRDVARSEVLDLAIDFGDLGTPSSPASAIVDETDGTTPVGMVGSASVVNTDQVMAIVTCLGMTRGHAYKFKLTATTNVSTGRRETRAIILNCKED